MFKMLLGGQGIVKGSRANNMPLAPANFSFLRKYIYIATIYSCATSGLFWQASPPVSKVLCKHGIKSARQTKILICKEGCRFSMGWCITALLPTLLCSLQRYYPNIIIIWDGQIRMFAILLRFTLPFVYKVYIGFLSRMCDWTVALAQFQ